MIWQPLGSEVSLGSLNSFRASKAVCQQLPVSKEKVGSELDAVPVGQVGCGMHWGPCVAADHHMEPQPCIAISRICCPGALSHALFEPPQGSSTAHPIPPSPSSLQAALLIAAVTNCTCDGTWWDGCWSTREPSAHQETEICPLALLSGCHTVAWLCSLLAVLYDRSIPAPQHPQGEQEQEYGKKEQELGLHLTALNKC